MMSKPGISGRRRFDPFLLLIFLLVLLLTLILARAVCTLPMGGEGLAGEVARFQQQSGVESPVTAVLLNFRGYDTLLEVMVLLLAVIGVWSLATASFVKNSFATSPVQISVVRLLAPLMCLVAAYLVRQGTHLAGGAFQGGAVLGAAGVLLLVTELPWLSVVPSLLLRIGLLLGPLCFLAVAILCMFSGRQLLQYPSGEAGWIVLLIESACAVSIGLTLASLFAGGRPGGDVSDD